MNNNFFKTLSDLVYPENLYCICCGDTIEQSRIHGLCDRCISKMQWFTDNPYKNQMDEFSFSDIYPCCIYGFYARRVISKIKLSGTPYAAKGIGLLMGERLLNEIERRNIAPDCIIAVPMHSSKLAVRGYNQTELLAGYADRVSGVRYLKGALTKTKATVSMRMSDAVTRKNMLKGTFAVNEAYRDKLRGKHIILLDDVVTTGSTVDAVSGVLLDAGASRIDVLCFAVSANKKDGLQ